MRRSLRLALVCLLGFSSAFVVACGESNDLIPSTDAEKLLENISAVDEAVNSEDCRAARDAAVEAQRAVDELPEKVNADLKDRLAEGVDNLRVQARDQCAPRSTESTESDTTTEETLTEEVTTEEPTTTEEQTTTEAPPTTTEAPPTTQETPPPDNGPGNGGGNGNQGGGNGNGGGFGAPGADG